MSENERAGNGAEAAAGEGPGGGLGSPKLAIFLWCGGGVLVVDLITKWVVQQNLPLGRSVPVFGDLFRLTHIMNPGAAFGLHLGDHSRVIFVLLTLFALAFLGAMYWYAERSDVLRLVAVSLLVGGALGNLLDRVRFSEGVVDFFDVGVGSVRWPVFNVADMGITVGAILLAFSIWQEERASGREASVGKGGVGEGAAGSHSS